MLSLRFRLILLVLMAVLPVLAISIWSGIEQRRVAQSQATADAFRFTRLITNYQASLANESQNLLQFLSAEPELRSLDTCASLLQHANQTYNLYASLTLVERSGRAICSSMNLDQGINLSDRVYFREALESGDFIIGDIVTDRLSNQLVQPFAAPVRGADGSIEAVLIATLDLSQVLNYAARLELPAQSAMLMVNDQGTVITRYPESETWAGKNLPQVPIIEEILRSGGEGSAEAQGVDGITRLYAFSPMQSSTRQHLYVSVGIPTATAYASANRLMRINVAWIGAVTLLALATAWFGGDVLFLRVVSLTAERDRAEAKLREANATLEARVAERTEELAKSVEQLRKQETQLRKLLRRVEESNRDLQDFAYIASHDLQEPLRKIQAFSDRLERRFSEQLGEEGKAFLSRVSSSAERMQAMINALLAYSRVNTKGQAFAPTDLREVLEQVLEDLEIRLRETQGQVQVEDLPTVEADPVQMQQLFQNLVSNALKFHQPGIAPRIQVTADRETSDGNGHVKTVSISVKDNGIGFEDRFVDKIFQPFQRLHSREEYDGNGIGLAVCRKIVERHNGIITAQSTPNAGSCFTITLPITQPRKE